MNEFPPEDGFGYRVRQARVAKGFGWSALARMIHVTSRDVRRWESGERKNPRLRCIIALADALEVTIGWLVAGRGEGPWQSNS